MSTAVGGVDARIGDLADLLDCKEELGGPIPRTFAELLFPDRLVHLKQGAYEA
jgi:hypothetical protein